MSKKKNTKPKYKGSKVDLKNKNTYKTTKTTTPAKQQGGSGKKERGGLISFFRGVSQELKKVVWLTKEELATDTVVVIVCVVFFAVAFWAIDTGFLAALKEVLGITLS